VAEHVLKADGTYTDATITWGYDGLNRLTSETYDAAPAGAGTLDYKDMYIYDPAGNRLSKTHDAGNDGLTAADDSTTTYWYGEVDTATGTLTAASGNDRLKREVNVTHGASPVTTATTYGYDANGSLTIKTVNGTPTLYTYNLRDRLWQVNTGGTAAPEIEYGYDDAGDRVLKKTGTDGAFSSETHFLVDANNPTGNSQVLEEFAALGTAPSRTYAVAQDVICQADASRAMSYLLSDGHGSTRQLAGETGTVTETYAYDAFGNGLTSNPASPATTLLYSGEQWDAGLGMQYLRARYYDATIGRFSTFDSYLGQPQDPATLHKYLYCGGSPINRIDPSGYDWSLSSVFATAGINAALAGTVSGAYGYAKGWSWGQIATFSAVNAGIAFAATFGFFGLAYGLSLGGASIPTAITAAGLIVAPTTLGLAIGNFQYALEHGDDVDKAFATVDLALAMYGTYRVAASTRSLPIREEAFAAAAAERLAAMRELRRTDRGAAGVMLLNGDPFPGRSINAGGRSMPIDPGVERVLEGLRQTCVEPRAASAILASGRNPRGAWSAVVQMSSGERLDACTACKHLLKTFGINDANRPDYQPLLFLISSFFPDVDKPQ
jgi:RHS repeat-associated protein